MMVKRKKVPRQLSASAQEAVSWNSIEKCCQSDNNEGGGGGLDLKSTGEQKNVNGHVPNGAQKCGKKKKHNALPDEVLANLSGRVESLQVHASLLFVPHNPTRLGYLTLGMQSSSIDFNSLFSSGSCFKQQLYFSSGTSAPRFISVQWLEQTDLSLPSLMLYNQQLGFCVLNTNATTDIFRALGRNEIVVKLGDVRDDQMRLDVFLRPSAFTPDPVNDFVAKYPRKAHCFRRLVYYFRSIKPPEHNPSVWRIKEDLSQFYRQLKQERVSIWLDLPKVNPQHRSLIPCLRGYQRDAVSWMLSRESQPNTFEQRRWESLFTQITDGLHSIWYNSESAMFIETDPSLYQITSYPGGILADEMGLGKTVEMLACVLLNPRPLECDATTERSDSPAVEQTDVEMVLEEIVSKVVGMIDCMSAYQTFSPKRKTRRSTSRMRRCPSQSQAMDDGGLKCTCFTSEFECNNLERIQCSACGSFQHKKCVKWIFDDEDGYFCPRCVIDQPPTVAGATLIVAPEAIGYQWFEEIQKHIRKYGLKVHVYQGVRQGFVHPRYLADQDLVICTYETLRTEINYVDLPTLKCLRQPKKYMIAPSPLTAVNWWRICLDEAQMVEGVSTKTADMCVRLSAVNRWCITGTPIQKSVSELYGLLYFLGVAPYYCKSWWDQLLWRPFINDKPVALLQTMARVMWRNEKIDVVEQLGIPNQQHRMHWLDFTPVEEHFYRRTQENCRQNARTILARYSDHRQRMSDLDRHSIDQLMRPLLSLRRACVHPQVTRTGKYLPMNKKTVTMGQVLEKMIQDTKRECTDDHRCLVAALNGTAGLHCLRGWWGEAADVYRRVLASCRLHGDRFKSDRLQQIHTLHNLQWVLEEHRADIPPTVGDHQLAAQEQQLTQQFLADRLQQVGQTRQELSDILGKVQQLTRELLPQNGWYVEVGRVAVQQGIQNELLYSVREKQMGLSAMALKFGDVNGLSYVLRSYAAELERLRDCVRTSLAGLDADDMSSELFVHKVSQCHLRPVGGVPLENCALCETHRNFDEYEAKLFNFSPDEGGGRTAETQREEEPEPGPSGGVSRTVAELESAQIQVQQQLRKGTWAPSPQEQAFKALLQFAKTRANLWRGDVIKAGADHSKLFDLWKKEFSAMRALWMAIRDHVSQRDELHMALERLRFKTNDELKTSRTGKNEQPLNAIEPYELQTNYARLQMDVTVAGAQLERRLGHLNYLNNLERADSDRGNVDECRVCLSALGIKWALLVCGHCFCCDCMDTLCSGRYLFGEQLKCPVCRQRTHRTNISYVMTRAAKDQMHSIEVKGSYSTKVEEIVRCILSIGRSDPQAKSLIFSSWSEVLSIVSQALTENSVPHITLQSKSKQSDIALFRSRPDIRVLLLPVQSGAKGLNLVEATHVLLVEPLLNPADEEQAIGRVHRIGQTHTTTVHRFLIRSTIEERLHCILGDQCIDQQLSALNQIPLTIAHLAQLFAAD